MEPNEEESPISEILLLPIGGIEITLYTDGSAELGSNLDDTPEIRGMENLLVSCARCGVNVSTPEFLQAIELAIAESK